MENYRGEKQIITAGSNWDGAPPALDAYYSNNNGVLTFARNTSGGLFRCSRLNRELPKVRNEYRTIKRISVKFGGQSNWTLSITDEITDIVLKTGTQDKDLIITDSIELTPYESIKLVTAGNPRNEMSATVIFDAYNFSG